MINCVCMHVYVVCVCSSGIELVFVGTKSGLTRYLTLTDNLSDPSVSVLTFRSHNSLTYMYTIV